MRIVPIHFHEIDSTQTYAKTCISKNCTRSDTIYIITADIQTNGYGKYGAQWNSLKGNLHVTYIIPNQLCTLSPLRITQCASIAICAVLEKSEIYTKIKWYNDIMLNNKKMAGILSEKIVKDDTCYWVIGIGLNIKHSSSVSHSINLNKVYPNHHFDTNALSREILYEILRTYQTNPEMTNLEYEKKLAYIGQLVNFYNSEHQLSGYFIGITSSGQPILEINNNRHTLSTSYRMEYISD